MLNSMNDYYNQKFQAGLEYQDFIADQLRKADPCIIISTYASLNWQNGRGENSSGIEIKYDMKLEKTGNLYIETEEKSDAAIDGYTPSGILRNDATWLYLIGNYNEAYLFSKAQLKHLYLHREHWNKRGIREVEAETKTSRGFLYPAHCAITSGTCLKHFIFKK